MTRQVWNCYFTLFGMLHVLNNDWIGGSWNEKGEIKVVEFRNNQLSFPGNVVSLKPLSFYEI